MADLLVCPKLERYQELASGRMSAADKETLLEHLESCDACAQRLGTVRTPETLAELLWQAKTYCEGKSDEDVARLVERLSKLKPLEMPTFRPEEKTLPPQGPLTFRCSACGKNLKVKQSVAGKKVKCPHCQKTVQAPGADTLTCTAAPDRSKKQDLTDGATVAPSAPVSLTDPGTGVDLAPGDSPGAKCGGDTIGQEGNQNPELTEFLAPAQAPDELGRLGSYRVLAILGAGGMGVVYKAEDPQLKRLVALKAMLPGLGASTSARKRFLREAQSAAAIKHDHIVSIYQVGEERGVPYLAMEFLLGEPLDERLKRDKNLPLKEMLRIGCEMAEGLSAAHEAGLIHRDIKPANVWLEGKKARVKILDFGLARAADESQHLTQSGAIVGTPAYMAPEQAQGKPVDRRCDLFSLGVVLYRLCTGQMPFQGTDTVSTLMAVSTHEPPTPAKLNAQLPAELSELVMHLLAKDPAQRVGSAEEVVRVLTDLQRQVESGALAELKPGRSTPRKKALDKTNPDTVTKEVPTKARAKAVPPRSRRNLFIVAALGAAALLFVLLGGGVLVYQLLFRTSNGTLIVEVEGKDADVRFKDGKLLIFDTEGKLLYILAPSEKNKAMPFGKYRVKVEGADGLTLDSDNFEMTQKGWKVRVRVRPDESPPAKASPPIEKKPPTAEKGVLDYAEIHDADEKRFDAWIAQMKKDGLRPVRLSVQTVKNAPRYTAVAVKDDKQLPWEFSRFRDTDNNDTAKHLDKYWDKKYQVVAQGIYRDKAKTCEAFLWAKDESLNNDGIYSADVAKIERDIKAAQKAKNHLVSLAAVFVGNEAEYSVVIEDADGVAWQESHDLRFDDLKAYVEKHKADGWRPDHICYYGVGAKRLFGAILIKDPDKADWDVSWSLTAADYEEELSARKAQGIRPLTAIGHEDSTGAQRFSAIWIRYRDPNAKEVREVGEVRAPDLTKAKVLHRDTFDDPKSGFAHNEKDDLGEASYVDGKYVVKVAPKAYRSCGNGQYANFACEVTGRLVKPISGQWGLNIFNPDTKHGLAVTINKEGKLFIKPDPADVAKERGPKFGPITHPAIKKGDELNTLLVVVRGRDIEVYVNSIAVCPAFTMDRDITTGWASIAIYGGKEGTQAEFTRYTVLSAEGLPRAGAGADPGKAPPAEKKFKAPAAAFKHKIGMEFAVVPKGKGWLGGGGAKEGTKPVTVENDFFLGMYEVTQEEWETVMGFKHPCHFSRQGEGKDALAGVTDAELKRFPVENVSWNECQLFLKKLNELDKKPGWEYRLPTEAEWEYACRAGPGDKFQSAFDFYLEVPTNVLLTAQANFEHAKGLKRTRAVGSYPPNKLGLFDMHGNVSELTHDAQPEKDDDGNPKRNERGGGWTNTGDECNATGRFGWSAADRFRDVGLRVALVPLAKEPPAKKKK